MDGFCTCLVSRNLLEQYHVSEDWRDNELSNGEALHPTLSRSEVESMTVSKLLNRCHRENMSFAIIYDNENRQSADAIQEYDMGKFTTSQFGCTILTLTDPWIGEFYRERSFRDLAATFKTS